ncbi:MAG: hypothetical protein KC535_04000 [Nanoarchaeota archaeon]|nr:hypothetical protein [Nanoarchaeota archaeon]
MGKEFAKLKRGCLRKIVLLGLPFAIIYSINSQNSKQSAQEKLYQVPKTVQVLEAEYLQPDGKHIHRKKTADLEELIISTDSIDFEEDFKLTTQNYTLVKHSDWWISRQIGGLFSLYSKTLLWDWDMGQGLDGERSKAALAILENREDIKDLTVRINHNEVWEDTGRLFTDKKVKERNNLLARLTIGLASTFGGELFSETRRGDYYNPMTQTVVAYSNVESILAHEMGHHKDYQRFDNDWEYALMTLFPPTTLYKEAKASIYANDMLSEKDKNQTWRYLLPAFLTYIVGGVALTRKFIKNFDPHFIELKKEKKGEVEMINRQREMEGNSTKITANNLITVPPAQVYKTYLNQTAALFAGIEGYNQLEATTGSGIYGAAGFVIGAAIALKAGELILNKVTGTSHDCSSPLNYIRYKAKSLINRIS